MANTATEGDQAHRASVNAARTEPSVIMVAAPFRSICLPRKVADRPPMNSETEKTPNTWESERPRSTAMPGARMLKL